MAIEKFANLAEDELASGYTSGGSSISVVDASLFPVAGVFRVAIGNTARTIYRVDSVSGTTFTGGAEAFDGNASAGDTVTLVGSKGSMERLIQTPASGEIHTYSGALGVDRYGPIWKMPPMDQSSWSWTNQGGSSITQANGVVYFSVPTAAGENMRLRTVSAPSTPYKFMAAMIPNPMLEVNFQLMGICLRESGTGKVVSIMLEGLATASVIHLRKNTNATTNSAATTGSALVLPGMIFLRVGADGTLVTCEYSFDGVNFTTLLSEAKATFFTTAPNEVGICGLNFGSGSTQAASYLCWLQT